jgi:protocatechuate 3,4-dioxygenase beta subunit
MRPASALPPCLLALCVLALPVGLDFSSPPSAGAPAGSETAAARPEPGPDCTECPHWEAPAHLTDRMTIAQPSEPGTRLVLEGTIFRPDGKTPAPDVLLYAYHTNAQGYYAHGPAATGQGRWHGDLRGWLRTGPKGRYRIETIRPAPYPGRTIPAHIHMHVMAPGDRERFIDDVVFDDDPLVTASWRKGAPNTGGSGIVHLERDAAGVLHGRRDIVLPPE